MLASAHRMAGQAVSHFGAAWIQTQRRTCFSAVLGCVLLMPAWGKSDPPPPQPDWQTATNCQWQWLSGAGIALWAERCTLSTGTWAVQWRSETQAFELNHNDTWRGVVVQAWPIQGEHWQADMRDSLMASGHLPDDHRCHFQAVALRPAARTTTFYQLQAQHQAAERPFSERDQVPEPLCGPYGASTHGVRYFVHDLRTPDHIVFIDEGQERPMFDVHSIRILP